MKKTIAVLPGDGIGPEITEQAVNVLKTISNMYSFDFSFEYGLIGAAAIDKVGDPYPVETHNLCKQADAILFGAIGDPKYDNDPKAKVRPEQGLLRMRKELGLYANIRPLKLIPGLEDKSPIKKEIIKDVDFVVVRELTGGIYFGKRGLNEADFSAFDTCTYSAKEIERVSVIAYELANKRRRKVTLVDKANVLDTSRLWRQIVKSVAKNYPNVQTDYLFVDNAAMQLILNPRQFDVILTENMFGDILTDEASVLAGSLGLLPSASVGDSVSLYEPIHGSFPLAAGKNIANPVATILSAAMMLEMSFNCTDAANLIRRAVNSGIGNNKRTPDIATTTPMGTKEVGAWICDHLERISDYSNYYIFEEEKAAW